MYSCLAFLIYLPIAGWYCGLCIKIRIAYCLLLLPVAYCLLPIAYCPLSIALASCLLLWRIVNCLLPIVYCPCQLLTADLDCFWRLLIAYCQLHVAYCLLPIANCPLSIVHCLLPVVYCFLGMALKVTPSNARLVSGNTSQASSSNTSSLSYFELKCPMSKRPTLACLAMQAACVVVE